MLWLSRFFSIYRVVNGSLVRLITEPANEPIKLFVERRFYLRLESGLNNLRRNASYVKMISKGIQAIIKIQVGVLEKVRLEFSGVLVDIDPACLEPLLESPDPLSLIPLLVLHVGDV